MSSSSEAPTAARPTLGQVSIEALPAVEAALEGLVDPAYVVDQEFNLVWVNQAFKAAFGYRPRKRLPCHEVTRMEICGTERCTLRRCAGRGPAPMVETTMAGASEPDASCLAAGFALVHPETRAQVAAVGILRDNSAEVRLHKRYSQMLDAERNRKELLEQMVAERTAELTSSNATLEQANVDLERSRREVADILENIGQGILTIDDKLKIGREYSRASEGVFGRTELGGLGLPELLAPGDEHGRQRKELVEWLKLVFASPTLDWKLAKSMVEPEYRLRRADGRIAELHVDFEAIREDARVKRVMVLIQDLTEKRRLERAIESKDREMNESIEHLAELSRLDPEMYEAIFEEALEIVERSGRALVGIRTAGDPTRVIDGMFRDMHTLKGNAMSFGLVRVAAKAHWVEDAFSELRQSAGNLTDGLIAETEEKVRELGELFQRIQKMASRVLAPGGPKDNGAVRSGDREMKLEIDRAAVDDLLAWAQGHLQGTPGSGELLTRIRSLALVPLDRVYARFPKMVDDLAEALAKPAARLILDGGDVALEAKAFNQLANALVHLVRNAVDHGVESPAVRLTRGKPAHGALEVRAFHDGERLRIDVADDGGGIDGAGLVEVARRKGVLAEGEHPVGAEALALIFRPGFSTAAATTDVSGRGVGMDAVKAILEELGGGIEIETELGRGTTFRMWIPTAVALGEA